MAQGDDMTNPISRLQPNQFTKVTNRSLPAPTRSRLPEKSPDAARLRKSHVAAVESVNQAPVGYRRPEGMSHADFSWAAGGHHMFPNMQAQAGTPAINEPHAADPGITVQRRAEDLSRPEYDKGVRVLQNHGYGRNPVRELTDLHADAIDRIIGEHAAAGVNESASQHFYGGAPVTSHLSDEVRQKTHDEGISAAHNRFEEGVQHLSRSEHFQAGTEGLSSGTREQGARNIMAQATADTSPNSKWRTTNGWPNMEQAEESANAGMEGRKSKFITGRVQNHQKAADRTVEMLGTAHSDTPFAAHHYGDPSSAPKTIAFRGALVNPNSTDSYKVSDIHEGGVMLPGATTGKAMSYTGKDGKRFYQHPDDPPSRLKGAEPYIHPVSGKHDPSNARAENMLAESKGTVHALNDYASRSALTGAGLSRSVNHSDNIHAYQGAAWGSQQVHRPDITVSHADQYPVVRNWGAEGHSQMNELGRRTFGDGPQHMGPQFTSNPNTKKGHSGSTSTEKDVHRSQPYPIAP